LLSSAICWRASRCSLILDSSRVSVKPHPGEASTDGDAETVGVVSAPQPVLGTGVGPDVMVGPTVGSWVIIGVRAAVGGGTVGVAAIVAGTTVGDAAGVAVCVTGVAPQPATISGIASATTRLARRFLFIENR
jgi:hypothetical protein